MPVKLEAVKALKLLQEEVEQGRVIVNKKTGSDGVLDISLAYPDDNYPDKSVRERHLLLTIKALPEIVRRHNERTDSMSWTERVKRRLQL